MLVVNWGGVKQREMAVLGLVQGRCCVMKQQLLYCSFGRFFSGKELFCAFDLGLLVNVLEIVY